MARRRDRPRVKKRSFTSANAQAEAFRILRTNLDVALAEQDHPIIVVTSALPGEGKTATAVHLARSLALAGRRVVLVDLDLRHPDAHNILGVEKGSGASEVLRGLESVPTCLRPVPIHSENGGRPAGLYFLSTGASVPDPAELLDGPHTGMLLRRLAEQADIVLIDTPPLLPVADTLIIGRRATGAVLVIETRRTAVSTVEHAKNALERNGTKLLGVIVNKLQARDARRLTDYGYGYGYGYGTKVEPDVRPTVGGDGAAEPLSDEAGAGGSGVEPWNGATPSDDGPDAALTDRGAVQAMTSDGDPGADTTSR